jgi:hypothetical protein
MKTRIFHRIAGVAFGLSLFAFSPAIAEANDLQICKASDTTNPVTGTFHFSVTGGATAEVDVAVGECSAGFAATAGIPIVVIETAVAGTILTSVTATVIGGSPIPVTSDLTARSATVTLGEGQAPASMTFTNASIPGPPPVNGRWTGGGSIFTESGIRVTHGLELHCEISDLPNNLEINFAGNRFHLDVETSASCSVDPTTGIATIIGTGTGTYNGTAGATISFTLTDAGEPGSNDFASFLISFGGNVVLSASGTLTFGNQQFHKDNK